ncbi:hypothetical protein HDV06_004497 [Boothiomyces sp. JEL0866]|nr:hypothetical protein HDV06_004497 [Boothiomyces sp. JEL0866]
MSLSAQMQMSNDIPSLNHLYYFSQNTLAVENSDLLSNDHHRALNHTQSFAEISSSTKVESPTPLDFKSQDNYELKEHENIKYYIAGRSTASEIPATIRIREEDNSNLSAFQEYHKNHNYKQFNQANVISIISGYENLIAKIKYQHQIEVSRILEEKRAINEKLANIEYSNIIKPNPVIRQDHGLLRPVAIKSTEMHQGTIARLTLENEELKANVYRLHYISGLWEKYMNNIRVLKSENDNMTAALEKKQDLIKDLRHKISVLVVKNGELEARIDTIEPIQAQPKIKHSRWSKFLELVQKAFKKM